MTKPKTLWGVRVLLFLYIVSAAALLWWLLTQGDQMPIW